MKGTLSVRKTLVLGIGSTGLDVCEQLAEHLTWQYGDFERATWVRLLVLETAQPRSPLADRVIWGGMRRDEYVHYRTSPRATGAEFGFYEWQDGPTLQDVDNPADGAGNCRMLGRLCLFHPRTYNTLRHRVAEDTAALEHLSPKAIADKLGEPGLTVEIDRAGTVVYVVGTLCGGTCSGGAADLGYLVDVWSANKARRQAIFTVPHPAVASTMGPRYKKNSYYALKELNHYQLSHTSWSQRLPGGDSPHNYTDRPYDILRVVMPGGPGSEDVRRLNSMIAQYLAAAVGPAGLDIAASDVDASSKMVGGESIGFMRPLFSTLGIAALEYPGEHIQRAATGRLLASAYLRWTQHRLDTDAYRTACELFGAAELGALVRRLAQGSDEAVIAPFLALFCNLITGVPPTVGQVRQFLRDVYARLTLQALPEDAPITGPLPLVQTITANHERLLAQVRADIERLVDQWLLDPDGGPAFVAEVMRQAVNGVEGNLAAIQVELAASSQDSRTMREILDRQIDDIERGQRGFRFNKRGKLRRGWQNLLDQLRSYLASEARTQALNHIQRLELLRAIGDQYRTTTATILRRLDAVLAAFTQEASEQDRRWRQLAASSPTVNGRVYFDAEPPAARGTVTEEYYNLLRQRRYAGEPVTGWDEGQKELAAIREVISSLSGLREELRRDEGQSAFDPRPGVQSARDAIPAAVLDAASARARQHFAPLRDQVHIADKASEVDLATVVQMSQPRLGISAAQVSGQLAGVKGATPMESYLAFMDLGPSENEPREAIARVQQAVRNSMTLRKGITPSGDPFRLLVLREKHGFTLGQMEGVVRTNPYDHHALQSAEGCADFRYWHTRRDVDWVDPLTPPSLLETVEEGWLLLVLLGSPADPGLPWLPSTAGEIPSQGWYQLTGGEYYVTFPPDVDAGESGDTVPLSYDAAIARLMASDRTYLQRTLSMRFSTYCNAVGPQRVVRLVDRAVRSLATFGIAGIDTKRAERIVRRAFRRSDELTRAFFDYRMEGVGPSEFTILQKKAGDPIPGRPSQCFPADGYYCPDCWRRLGTELGDLLAALFRCPACNTEERYWP